MNPKEKESGFVVVERKKLIENPTATNLIDASEGAKVLEKDKPEKTQDLGPKPKREKNYRRKNKDEQFLKQKREEYAEMIKRQTEKAHKLQELQEALMSRWEKSQ